MPADEDVDDGGGDGDDGGCVWKNEKQELKLCVNRMRTCMYR